MRAKVTAKVVVLGVGLFAIVLAFGWWWQTGNRKALVATFIPPTPDLSAFSSVFAERISIATARAQERLHSGSGLAELSRLYHANGFLKEAAGCYDGLELIEPGEPKWMHLHAIILAGYGELDSAMQLWQRVVKRAPNYIPAQLRLGDAQFKANRIEEATAAYSAVLQRESTNAYAQFGLARIDYETGRLVQARERLEAIVNQTNYEIGYDLIVSLYEKIGETDRARAIRGMAKASGAYRDPPDPWLDSLIDDCYDPYRLSLSAGIAAHTHQLAAAIHFLERAIELAPNSVSAHFQLGCLAFDQGNLRLAREHLERCITLSPDFADAWAWLSMLEAKSGNSIAAARALSVGLSHCPDSPGLHLAQARYFQQVGNLNAAANEFSISLRLRPNEPDAFIELGNLLVAAGRTEEGVAQIRGALIAEPGNPTALGILAFYAITTKNEGEANRWLERVSQQPRIPADTIARLLEAYREVFGKDYQPAR